MQHIVEDLILLLEEKCVLLGELIQLQVEFREFMIRPDWSRFGEVTAPQNALMARLNQSQQRQRTLLDHYARARGLRKIGSLAMLEPLLPAREREIIAELRGKIRMGTMELKRHATVHQALQQSHQRFVNRWADAVKAGKVFAGTYNAQGRQQHFQAVPTGVHATA